MEKVSRRSAMRASAAGAVTVGSAVLGGTAMGDEPKAPKLWTLEGELKVHPKFLYGYYLSGQRGQGSGPSWSSTRQNAVGSCAGTAPTLEGRISKPISPRKRARNTQRAQHRAGLFQGKPFSEMHLVLCRVLGIYGRDFHSNHSSSLAGVPRSVVSNGGDAVPNAWFDVLSIQSPTIGCFPRYGSLPAVNVEFDSVQFRLIGSIGGDLDLASQSGICQGG